MIAHSENEMTSKPTGSASRDGERRPGFEHSSFCLKLFLCGARRAVLQHPVRVQGGLAPGLRPQTQRCTQSDAPQPWRGSSQRQGRAVSPGRALRLLAGQPGAAGRRLGPLRLPRQQPAPHRWPHRLGWARQRRRPTQQALFSPGRSLSSITAADPSEARRNPAVVTSHWACGAGSFGGGCRLRAPAALGAALGRCWGALGGGPREGLCQGLGAPQPAPQAGSEKLKVAVDVSAWPGARSQRSSPTQPKAHGKRSRQKTWPATQTATRAGPRREPCLLTPLPSTALPTAAKKQLAGRSRVVP